MSFVSKICDHLEEIVTMLEFHDENKFKVSAYKNAVLALSKDYAHSDELINTDSIGQLKGIGKGIEAVIYEVRDSGTSTMLADLKKDIPETFFELFKIRGLGPKKLSALYKEYNIVSMYQLKKSCENGSLSSYKGFGQAMQTKILEQIQLIERSSKFVRFNRASALAEIVRHSLEGMSSIRKQLISGELVRIREVIPKIEFVILINDREKTLEEISKVFKNVINTEISFIINDYEIACELFIAVDEKDFNRIYFESVSGKEYLESINYSPTCFEKDDATTFAKMKIAFAPVPQRETGYYYDKTLRVKESNLDAPMKGMLHFHTNWSDGVNSLEEMLLDGSAKGFDYFAVCDHSKSAFYAQGLSEQRVLDQKNEIEELRVITRLNVLQGIESDILTDGSLDYAQEFLHNFDFIVASIHSQFSLSEDDMTKRIIKAVENPRTNVLGHPTGRLLLHREGYKLNMKKILDACAANKTAIEINANPHRLDLDWRWIPYALDKGCLFAINADAHSVNDIDYVHYGKFIAMKGGLQQSEIINYFSFEEFKSFIKK